MKKLYLSLAAALLSVTAMSAKELTFYVGNTAVQPGATVKYELQDGDVDDFGDYAEYNIQPGVYLHADLIGQVEVNVVSNLDVEVCVGQCYTGTDITRTTTIQSGQKLDLKYHIMGETEGGAAVPTFTSTFTACYTDDKANTTKTFTIVVNTSSGTATIVADDAVFRAVSGGIQYTVGAPTAAALYSITGKKVLSANIHGNGTLSTANLPAGIYIYTLNGKSGKIVLK